MVYKDSKQEESKNRNRNIKDVNFTHKPENGS